MENHHPIDWEETTVLDHGRVQELLMKEALHIDPDDTLRGAASTGMEDWKSLAAGSL